MFYEDELTSKIVHAHKMKGQVLGEDSTGQQVRITVEQVQDWTRPEVLTAALLGLVNVESRIRVTAGARFGGGSSKKMLAKGIAR